MIGLSALLAFTAGDQALVTLKLAKTTFCPAEAVRPMVPAAEGVVVCLPYQDAIDEKVHVGALEIHGKEVVGPLVLVNLRCRRPVDHVGELVLHQFVRGPVAIWGDEEAIFAVVGVTPEHNAIAEIERA